MTSFTERVWPRMEWLVLFLAGPAIWYTHFWVIYLLAEAGCFMARREGGSQPVWLVVVILIATVGAVALIGWTTWVAWRKGHRMKEPPGNRSALHYMGFLMGPLFALATLFVGLPIAYLPPC